MALAYDSVGVSLSVIGWRVGAVGVSAVHHLLVGAPGGVALSVLTDSLTP